MTDWINTKTRFGMVPKGMKLTHVEYMQKSNRTKRHEVNV